MFTWPSITSIEANTALHAHREWSLPASSAGNSSEGVLHILTIDLLNAVGWMGPLEVSGPASSSLLSEP